MNTIQYQLTFAVSIALDNKHFGSDEMWNNANDYLTTFGDTHNLVQTDAGTGFGMRDMTFVVPDDTPDEELIRIEREFREGAMKHLLTVDGAGFAYRPMYDDVPEIRDEKDPEKYDALVEPLWMDANKYTNHLVARLRALVAAQNPPEPRQEFLNAVTAKAHEYADEAEHQDGYEYWDRFESTEEAVADLARYITAEYEHNLVEVEKERRKGA